jgi:DNA-binding beta-propeller fold protein YncE
MVRRRALKPILFAILLAAAWFHPAIAEPLNKIGSIALGSVAGPINALALDYANQRLFVLEGGAGHLIVVDLAAGAVSQTIEGLTAPTGLARAPAENRLYVGTGEGKIAIYAGVPLVPQTGIFLGPDLGSLHYDPGSERIYLGFGATKVAILDTTHNKHWQDIRLDGRPGPLALEDGGSLIFVGAAGEKRILVADRDGNKQTGSWSTGDNAEPASLALDEDAGRLIAAFQQPTGLAWFDLADGSLKGRVDACAKPGQLLSDGSRSTVYLTCGEGRIDVFHRDTAGNYGKTGSVDTVAGATAALLVPISGRIYLAVPSVNGQPAEIRIYAPAS